MCPSLNSYFPFHEDKTSYSVFFIFITVVLIVLLLVAILLYCFCKKSPKNKEVQSEENLKAKTYHETSTYVKDVESGKTKQPSPKIHQESEEPDLESEPAQNGGTTKPHVQKTAAIHQVSATAPLPDTAGHVQVNGSVHPQGTEHQITQETGHNASDNKDNAKTTVKPSRPSKNAKESNGTSSQRIFIKPSSRESERGSASSKRSEGAAGEIEYQDLLNDEELDEGAHRRSKPVRLPKVETTTHPQPEMRGIPPLYKANTELPPVTVRSQPAERMGSNDHQNDGRHEGTPGPVQESRPNPPEADDHLPKISEVFMRNYLLANVAQSEQAVAPVHQPTLGDDYQAWNHQTAIPEEVAEGDSLQSSQSTTRQPSNKSTADSTSSYIKENSEHERTQNKASGIGTSVGPRASGRGRSRVGPETKVYRTQVHPGKVSIGVVRAATSFETQKSWKP